MVENMKICIPSNNGKGLEAQIDTHFGRAPIYTIIETDTNTIEIVKNTSNHTGGNCFPVEILVEKNISTMLCQGIGHGALTKLAQYNITVYIGASGKVKDALAAFKDQKLTKASIETACTGHGHHHCHCEKE